MSQNIRNLQVTIQNIRSYVHCDEFGRVIQLQFIQIAAGSI